MQATKRTDDAFLADKCAQDWSAVMVRVSAACPTGIDDLLCDANALARSKKGKAIFPNLQSLPAHRAISDEDRPIIGVLLDDRTQRIAPDVVHLLATRYAALAIEKECEIVILSHQNNAGFERFGFRVERITGQTAQAQQECIEQLKRFWGIDIFI